MNRRKVFIMLGVTGHGKSTLGNCIFNQSGELKDINSEPFATSDSANGCTRRFSFEENAQQVIIDTVGFADPQFANEEIIRDFKNALNHVNYQVDCILFVLKVGRVSNEIVDFFELIQNEILLNRCRSNCVLIITGAPPGWIERQAGNTELQRILDGCNRCSYEFSLKFDRHDDDDDDKIRNITKRRMSINEIVNYLNTRNFQPVELNHLRENAFWDGILPRIVAVTAALAVAGLTAHRCSIL